MARKKKNSAKVNLLWSVGFHSLLVIGIYFLAASTGVLPPQYDIIQAVVDKKKEEPKAKPPEPKVEPPKEEPHKGTTASTPPPVAPPSSAPPPDQPASVAPPPAETADLDFSDGAKTVISSTNIAVDAYSSFVEYTLRSNWNRPEDMQDDSYVAEVEVQIDPAGTVRKYSWKKKTGDQRWDDSVAQALASTKTITRGPPKGFPDTFLVRFDVVPATEEIQ